MAPPSSRLRGLPQMLGHYLAQQTEVANYQTYVGLSGPYNFNGLVRHYYLRHQPNQADIQVNLLPIKDRSMQSHTIAKRLRPELVKLALPFGARIKVSEVPPGPPVIQTLVAEVYGPEMSRATRRRSQNQTDLSANRGRRRYRLVCRGPSAAPRLYRRGSQGRDQDAGLRHGAGDQPFHRRFARWPFVGNSERRTGRNGSLHSADHSRGSKSAHCGDVIRCLSALVQIET